MIFVLSKLGWVLVRPGNLLALMLILGLIFQAARRPPFERLGRRMVAASVLLVAALTLLPVGQMTLRPLEDRFPQPVLPERVDGIVLLGGSVNTELSADRGQPVLNSAGERITEFVALARRYPEAKLIFTGGSGYVFAGDLREADVIRTVLDGIGFDTPRIVFERESRNTYENALFSRPLVNPAPDETWLLITSAAHMPRSVGIFRHAGWPVLAYPVDYRAAGSLTWGPDFLSGLDSLNESLREWVGLAAYRLMDRTDSWFPGPVRND